MQSLQRRWRILDFTVAGMIGVLGGIIFFGYNWVNPVITTPLQLALPGSQALLSGVWLIPAVLGAAIIRKPGAAVLTEVIAATVSALLGAQWGLLTLESGLVQGLGAELVFALFGYRVFTAGVLALAGAVSGLAMALNELVIYYAETGPWYWLVYLLAGATTGALIAGVGSHLLVTALSRAGALNRFAAGRTRQPRE